MKPVILTIVFLFPFILLAQQDELPSSGNKEFITYSPTEMQSSGYNFKTKTKQIWNNPSSTWENDSLHYYFYNNQLLLDSIIYQMWDSQIWINERKLNLFYNNDNLLQRRDHYEMLTTWKLYDYNLYEYSLGYLNKITSYDGLTGISFFIQNHFRNSSFLDTMISHQLKHHYYGYWYEIYRDELEYDSNNSLIQRIEYTTSNTPTSLTNYSYYPNLILKEEIIKRWTGNDWMKDKKYDYYYLSNNKLKEKVYSSWDTNDSLWQYVWRENYSYDSNDSLITIIKENWDSTGTWVNDERRDFTYEPLQNNYLVEELLRKWNGNSWVNIKRYLWDYEFSFTSVDDPIQVNKFELYQNYPNPFNPSTKISWQTAVSGRQTLRVYDVLGNEVATLVNEYKPAGSYEVEFNPEAGIKHPASGIYFYKLQAGDFVETKKMIYLK